MYQYVKKLGLLLFALLAFSSPIYPESSSIYVEKVHAQIVEAIKSNIGSYTEDPERFIKAISDPLEPLVDFKRISRYVMGEHFIKATSEQKRKFHTAFKKSLLDTYSKTLAEFKDEEIIVSHKTQKSKEGKREKVFLEIVTDTKSYPAIYYMYLNNQEKWMLYNIIIDGVNLSLVFRKQFNSLMKVEKDLDRVIETWVSTI